MAEARIGLNHSSEEFEGYSILEGLKNSQNDGFSFIDIPIRLQETMSNELGFHNDTLLRSSQWASYVIGHVSEKAVEEICSCDKASREKGEEMLLREISWACHVSLPAVIFSFNHELEENVSYLRCLNQILVHRNCNIWININAGSKSSWIGWMKLSKMSNFNPKLGVVLELPEDLPLLEETGNVNWPLLLKWTGEPLKAIRLNTSLFVRNRKGYPILSKQHQSLLLRLAKFTTQVILQGPSNHSERLKPYLEFVNNLYSRIPPPTPTESFCKGYVDYLQSPLQPLQDHLRNETYEVFEQDPVKYERYQVAIQKAIENFQAKASNDEKIRIMVAGAGRAPLVKAAIKSCQKLEIDSRKIDLFALEKNPNAVFTIKNLKSKHSTLTSNDIASRIEHSLWKSLTIIESDMRLLKQHKDYEDLKLDQSVHIVVSELLGSFGDNELSPECLDGVECVLRPDGISIPQSYTSYVAPISYSKGWSEIKRYKDIKYMETIYVVQLHRHFCFSESKPCFTFDHPSTSSESNERFQQISFEAQHDGFVHGFAGYFTATLFDDVKISINPQELHLSPDMFSWFACYIPLVSPLFVKEGEDIELSIWRKCSPTKVWYEWCVTDPAVSEIQNPNGRSYAIGLLTDSQY